MDAYAPGWRRRGLSENPPPLPIMNKPQTIEGRWWIFGKAEAPQYGVLSYHPETGLELSVKIATSCNFSDVLSNIKMQDRVPKTIIGRDQNDYPVSLFGCSFPGVTRQGGLQTIKARPLAALSGCAFDNWDEVQFDHIHTEYTLLHDWMQKSRISIKDDDGTRLVTVSKRETIEIPLPDGVKLIIWQTGGYQHHATGLELKEGHGIEFRFPAVQPMETLLKYTMSFQRMLTFLIGTPVITEKIYFHPKNEFSASKAILLRTNSGIKNAEICTSNHFVIVDYRDIQTRLNEVVWHWYALESRLKDVFNLYFSVVFNDELYSNHRFLFLAQALEVYHRTNPQFEGAVQSRQDFQVRRDRIIEAVPDEKKWLKEKLAFANEKTFFMRLLEILEFNKEETKELIDDPECFARIVKNTRNHFTHYATHERQRDGIPDHMDLLQLTDKMKMLLEISIFKELKLSGDPIQRLVHYNRSIQYVGI